MSADQVGTKRAFRNERYFSMIEKRDRLRELGASERQIRENLNLSYIQYHNFNHRVLIDSIHNWTDEEVKFLIECYGTYCTDWETITKNLNTKFHLSLTPPQVKNKFYVCKKGKMYSKYFETHFLPVPKRGRRPVKRPSTEEECKPIVPSGVPLPTFRQILLQNSSQATTDNNNSEQQVAHERELGLGYLTFFREPDDFVMKEIIERAIQSCYDTNGNIEVFSQDERIDNVSPTINTYLSSPGDNFLLPVQSLNPLKRKEMYQLYKDGIPNTNGQEIIDDLDAYNSEERIYKNFED